MPILSQSHMFALKINFPSLVATKASRMGVAARGGANVEEHIHTHTHAEHNGLVRRKSQCVLCNGERDEELPIMLAEFGVRRAQGPDGGKVN